MGETSFPVATADEGCFGVDSSVFSSRLGTGGGFPPLLPPADLVGLGGAAAPAPPEEEDEIEAVVVVLEAAGRADEDPGSFSFKKRTGKQRKTQLNFWGKSL